jgi:hypothetical protein
MNYNLKISAYLKSHWIDPAVCYYTPLFFQHFPVTTDGGLRFVNPHTRKIATVLDYSEFSKNPQYPFVISNAMQTGIK